MTPYILNRHVRSRTDYPVIMGLIRSGKPVYFIRYGDGEIAIMLNRRQNRIRKTGFKPAGDHSGWAFDPANPDYAWFGPELWKSFEWRNPRYVMGTPNPDTWTRSKTAPPPALVLNAYVFGDQWKDVFYNWGTYLAGRRVVMVSHRKAKFEHLPFRDAVVAHVPVPPDALRTTAALDAITARGAEFPKGYTWLFGAGPLAKVAVRRLAEAYPENSYIDVGSVLDPLLQLGVTRKQFRAEMAGHVHPTLGIIQP